MASFAEAMKWHTERFLGYGPGRNVDAYPRQADDGSVEWWTFDGQRTESPLGQSAIYAPVVEVKYSKAAVRATRNLGEALCSIACANKMGCRGMYAYDHDYNDARCGDTFGLVRVTPDQYEEAGGNSRPNRFFRNR